jgi:hypothetical protein
MNGVSRARTFARVQSFELPGHPAHFKSSMALVSLPHVLPFSDNYFLTLDSVATCSTTSERMDCIGWFRSPGRCAAFGLKRSTTSKSSISSPLLYNLSETPERGTHGKSLITWRTPLTWKRALEFWVLANSEFVSDIPYAQASLFLRALRGKSPVYAIGNWT